MAPQTRLAKIHELELEHQSHVHNIGLIIKDEESRRLKVSNLLLNNDISSLQAQIAKKEDDLRRLSERENGIRATLAATKETCGAQEKRLKQQERETAKMKAELEYLDGVSKEATTTHTDKLVLTRELEMLRPEIEHLRLQQKQHKSTLAEKLALENQVSSLDVQIESEKQTTQRLQARVDVVEARLSADKQTNDKAKREADAALEELQNRLNEAETKLVESQKQARERIQRDDSDAIDQLRHRLQEVESELGSERKAASKARKESEKALTEVNTEISALKERVKSLKTKLSFTQAELTSCRAELAQAAKSKAAPSEKTTTARPHAAPATKPAATKGRRKRTAAEASTDEVALPMHTPSNDAKPRRTLKRKGIEQSLVGEKSMFSITPFLAKARTLGDDSVASQPSPSEKAPREQATATLNRGLPIEPATPLAPVLEKADLDHNKEEAAGRDAPEDDVDPLSDPAAPVGILSPTPANDATEKQNKTRGRPKKAPVGSPQGQKGATPKAAPRPPSSLAPLMPKPTPASRTAAPPKAKKAPSFPSDEDESRRKKRKLLLGNTTSTIFEEAEDEIAQGAPVQLMAPQRLAGKAMAGGAGAGARRLGKAILGPGVSKAFAGAAFSPLKRDRRGVNASFLA